MVSNIYVNSIFLCKFVALFLLSLDFNSIGSKALSQSQVVFIDENTWTNLLADEWFVEFYAPWCPACQSLEPDWERLAKESRSLHIKVASADVTANPGLSGRFVVSSLPTIYHVKDGVFRHYNGPRDIENMRSYIREQKWKSVEPISKWREPNTILMSVASYSFRISMALRDLHNHLVEELGVPFYLSYLLFALCSVTLVIVMTFILIFLVDQFIPSKRPQAKKTSKKRSSKKDSKSNDSDLDETDTRPTSSGQKSTATSDRVRRRAN